METKRLHELIELARAGKKFNARRIKDSATLWRMERYFVEGSVWTSDAIVALWEYKEIREPQVLEFEASAEMFLLKGESVIYFGGSKGREMTERLHNGQWRIVATEILEEV